MEPLALASFAAFAANLGFGLFALGRRPRAAVHVAFFFLALLSAGWSCCYVFARSAATAEEYLRWHRPAMVLVALLPSLTLHFCAVLTGIPGPAWRRRLHWLAYLPGLVLAVRAVAGQFYVGRVERTAVGWVETVQFHDPWTAALTAWTFLGTAGGLALAVAWLVRTRTTAERRPARLVVASGAVTIVLVFATNALGPATGWYRLPSLGDVAATIWFAGLFAAITRHGLMTLTPAVAADQIVRTMTDGVLLFDASGRLLTGNPAAARLFGTSEARLLGRTWSTLLAPERERDADALSTGGRTDSVPHLETAVRSEDRGEVPVVVSAAPVRDPRGEPLGSVAVLRDDSERRRVEQRLEHLARHDGLTDLPNRLQFQDRLQQALYRARRYGKPAAVLLLDLDRFKELNDALGHAAGDRVLQAAARRIGESIRKCDTAARLGGDEFAVALGELRAAEDAGIVARRILARFAEPVPLAQGARALSASIGIAAFPDHGHDPASLLRAADLALYEAKGAGRGCSRTFEPTMSAEPVRRELERRLRAAIDERQLLLHYQPQVSLATGEIVGVEALVRWMDPARGMVSPREFLPVAEETGLIGPIGEWVLRTACAQAAAWRAAGARRVVMAINLSPRQLLDERLPDTLGNVLSRVGLAPGDLELEVTEEGTTRDPRRSLAVLSRLHELGLRLAVDDFGAGRTSLEFLTRFPGQTVKIAPSFLQGIPERAESRALVAGLVPLARELGLERIVAVGVEHEDQRRFLREIGCGFAQGYAVGTPAGASETALRLGVQVEGPPQHPRFATPPVGARPPGGPR